MNGNNKVITIHKLTKMKLRAKHIIVIFISMVIFFLLFLYYLKHNQINKSDTVNNNLEVSHSNSIGEKLEHVTLISENVTIITYANSIFYRALKNFVGSVHFWEPGLKIVVYDIGMSRKQINKVRRWRNTKLVDFNFNLYPAHFTDLHTYAFKPIIINKTLHEYGYIFANDAGQEFRQPITKIKEWIKRDGFFITNTGAIGRDFKLTHTGVMDNLNITLQKGHCLANFVGVYRDHPEKKQTLIHLIEELANCAMIKDCIAPEGADLTNHRFDQAALTLLTQKYNITCIGGPEVGCWVEGKKSYPPLTSDPTKTNDIIVCDRRRNLPTPYEKYLQYD